MRQLAARALLACLVTLVALGIAACDDESPSGQDDLDVSTGDLGDTADPGDTGTETRADTNTDTGADTSTPDTSADTGEDADTDDTAVDTGGDTADMDVAPSCDAVSCDPGQHCELDAQGQPACVDDTCADLQCGPTERCEVPDGGGPAMCVDISCTTSDDCAPEAFCDGAICQADVCTAGARSCDGADLQVCASDGSGVSVLATCEVTLSFPSTCVDAGNGNASCSCGDDWDCPANMVCEASTCRGTGQAPSCTLPTVPFQSVPPNNEIQWGGTSIGNKTATGRPWPANAQVLMTPTVANLTDDNGDGQINELDFPEIVFMTYPNSGGFRARGVLRAIHGGGASKGEDLFANCGATTWHQGEALPAATDCTVSGGVIGIGGIAIGDLDDDGTPEIVAPIDGGGLRIVDNLGNVLDEITGVFPTTSPWASAVEPHVSIANLDGAGFAEIIVGNLVFTVTWDANQEIVFSDVFRGALGVPGGFNNFGPLGCVADISGGNDLEVITGSVAWRLPARPAGAQNQGDCVGNGGAITPGSASEQAWCDGSLEVVWDVQTDAHPESVETNLGSHRDGFCAVADVLGADETTAPGPMNPLDGEPEVVLIANGYLLIINGEQGILRRSINLGGGTVGGAPNIDDFDGDGFPEIASALSAFYVVHDLQEPTAACPLWPTTLADDAGGLNGNPARDAGGSCTQDSECNAGGFCNTDTGTCACLHNGWQQDTEDDSSRATSSSVFDFNSDGSAEVVYNDECYFRIYDGANGSVLFKEPSLSRTAVENPVVADVDNDGNAEIVFATNNEVRQCSESIDRGNGIGVWGDPSDTWVSARRVWNQHAYHVTNVREDASIPVNEPPSWQPLGGRLYNTFRSQPRSGGIAPDLVVTNVQLTSPGSACGQQLGDQLDIVVRIENHGDVRVGPGVILSFVGSWAGTTETLLDAAGQPLEVVLQTSLEPGGAVAITASWDVANNAAGTLPDSIVATIDAADAERECIEDNNELTATVDAGMALADLTLEMGAITTSCPTSWDVDLRLSNDGAVDASDITIALYAGDPSQGGTLLHQEVVAGPLAPGAQTALTATIAPVPLGQSVILWAVADPADEIPECNDGNNADAAADPTVCQIN